MNISIREGNQDDCDLILKWTLNIHAHENTHILKLKKGYQDSLRSWITRELENTQSIFLIAEHTRQPIGFIFGYIEPLHEDISEHLIRGVIKLLWIENKMRKAGAATLLLDSIEDCFKECGASYVETQYTAINTDAKEFWQKSGYNQQAVTAIKLI